MKRKVIIMIFITITIVLCGLYLHYENTKLQVSNYKIVNNNIPVDFNNYKIVQISDFHNNQSNTLTNDLIKDKPTIEEILPRFMEFVGDSVLVAHNADFDIGFLKYNAILLLQFTMFLVIMKQVLRVIQKLKNN